MSQALWLLLETLGSLLATACLLRVYLNRLRIGIGDPIGQFVFAITDWIVRPLRRVIPARGAIDWASVVAALVLAGVLAMLFVGLFGGGRLPAIGTVAVLAIFWLIKWSLWLLTALVLLQAVLSWINPHAPVAPTINLLTRPFLAPVRRIVPLIGGMDLSPMVLILGIQVLLTLLQSIFPQVIALAG